MLALARATGRYEPAGLMLRAVLDIRLFRFVLVGGGAAGLFFVLTYMLALSGMPPFAASILAYAIAFVVAYTAQRGWTFGGRHAHSHSFPRYLALQAACALFSGVVAHAAVALFGLSPLAMSAVTAVLAGAASYVASSRWVFPDRD
jgi:putative flippase GtrA